MEEGHALRGTCGGSIIVPIMAVFQTVHLESACSVEPRCRAKFLPVNVACLSCIHGSTHFPAQLGPMAESLQRFPTPSLQARGGKKKMS